MLDEHFRRRVASLYGRSDDRELSELEEQRIVRNVVDRGPGLVLAARRRRIALGIAVPVLAAAAAIVLFVAIRGRSADAEGARAPVVVATDPKGRERACDGWAEPQGGRQGFSEVANGLKLDLGRVLAVATSGSRVALEKATACETVLSVGSGQLVVHAKDLGGGSLSVQTETALVSVKGTLFSVTERSASVRVEVVEGRVAVRENSRAHELGAGERLLVSPVGVASGRLEPDRARRIRALVRGPEVIGLDSLEPLAEDREARPRPLLPGRPAPAPEGDVGEPLRAESPEARVSPAELLKQAERLRRQGDYAKARDLYRQAGAGTRATSEAAWLALARMELGLGRASEAQRATAERRRRFGRGSLGPEALWIDVRTYKQLGNRAEARKAAEQLLARWPDSPQAATARRWLSEL